MIPTSPAPRSVTLTAAREHLDLPVAAVWLAYLSVGGNEPLRAIAAWLTGARDVPDREYDLMAQGLNDHFVERGLDHPVGYSTDSWRAS